VKIMWKVASHVEPQCQMWRQEYWKNCKFC